MINGPFFRNYPKQQPSMYSRSIPVQQTEQRPSPKVVSIPVHFISSDQPQTTISMLKDSAALKIQKVFRGFVVRKSVNKIVLIRNEVDEIERRVNDTEVVDLIRRDGKERLRVNETIMSLLFKLDSIRGVDCGIRDLRKAVTKKAIALQEKVDSIGQIDHQTLDSDDTDNDNTVCTSALEQVTEASVNVNSESVQEDENCSVVNEREAVKGADVSCEVEAMETSPAVNIVEKDDNCGNYDKEKRAILDSLMDDNEKLRKLMSQIAERNEMQTRMINALSRRVEQLEKAEKMRKRKKAHVSSRRKRDIDSLCI